MLSLRGVYLEKLIISFANCARTFSTRCVPITGKDYEDLRHDDIQQPSNPKILKVAIIGAPNAGKSTLVNSLINWRVASVSKQVHTTRKGIDIVHTEGDTQFVYMDTPGVIDERKQRRHLLEKSFIEDPHKALNRADIVAVVHDVSTSWGQKELDAEVLAALRLSDLTPSVLLMNKVDRISKKSKLLTAAVSLTNGIIDGERVTPPSDTPGNSWDKFSQVFMISALTRDGLLEFMAYLHAEAKPGRWEYSNKVVTTEKPDYLAISLVRASLLTHLPDELPYTIKISIAYWDKLPNQNVMRAIFILECHNSREHGALLGEGGEKLKYIRQSVISSLCNAFRLDFVAEFIVKLEKSETRFS